MSRKKHKLKFISLIFSVFIFLATSIGAPLIAYADSAYPIPNTDADFSVADQKNLENVTAYIENCLNKGGLEFEGFSTSQGESGEFFSGSPDYSVSTFVDADNKRSCEGAQAVNVLGKLYGKVTDFVKKYFQKGTASCGSPDKFRLKVDDCSTTGADRVAKIADELKKIYNDAKTRAKEKGYYFYPYPATGLPPSYATNVLGPLFEKCFKRHDPENDLDDKDVTIQGRDYVYKNGNQGNLYTGFIFAEPGDDGKIDCNELAAFINDDSNKVGYLVLSDSEIDDQIEEDSRFIEEAIKKAALIPLFVSDTAKFQGCIFGTPLATFPLGDAISVVAGWLASGGTGEITYSGPYGSQITIPATASTNVKTCLDGAFGESLQEILELEPETPADPNVEDQSSDSDSPSDDCLSKADQFIAWFACPIINIIDSVLEKIEDIIKGMLKFDLNKQNKDGGIKEAWNIFRGLASVLIMGGFLLALVIKGVKG